MRKQNEAVEEIAYNNKRLRKDMRYSEAGARTVAEVLDTMRKYPGTKAGDVLEKLTGH